jgi:hypothetical protein
MYTCIFCISDACWQNEQTFANPSQNRAWLGTEGHLGTGLTLHHQSFDPYGRHEMVQQRLNHNLSRASKQHQFCIRLAGKMNKLSPTRAKNSGMAWLGTEGDV